MVSRDESVVVLAGGVGGSKFLLGLSHVVPPQQITIIGNTGDDMELCGLRICPDLDTIAYTLSGKVDKSQGWGIKHDTFTCLQSLKKFGFPGWFRVGDKDLATHLWRTHLLEKGLGLVEVTARISKTLGIRSTLLPMPDYFTPTRLLTDQGDLYLQEYLVREKMHPRVRKIIYTNIGQSSVPVDVEKAMNTAGMVLLAPSNPFISIGPILEVPKMKSLLKCSNRPVVAISPVVDGKAFKGPAVKMLSELGYPPSALGVAQFLRGVVNCFVLDFKDRCFYEQVKALGMQVKVTNTIMHSTADKIALARSVIEEW